MIIPSEMRCDFCTNVIEKGTHYATLEVPIPPSLRREMIAFTKDYLRPLDAHPFAALLAGIADVVPSAWKLEICIACAYGIVPGIRETVVSQIRESISRAVDAKRREVESLDSLEEEPDA